MKKTLPFIHNQSGFFLPYILFIVAIVMIIIISAIEKYHVSLFIHDNQQTQITHETLFQMGHMAFKNDMNDIETLKGEKSYDFPSGKVNITYDKEDETHYSLLFKIYSNNRQSYKISHIEEIVQKE